MIKGMRIFVPVSGYKMKIIITRKRIAANPQPLLPDCYPNPQ